MWCGPPDQTPSAVEPLVFEDGRPPSSHSHSSLSHPLSCRRRRAAIADARTSLAQTSTAAGPSRRLEPPAPTGTRRRLGSGTPADARRTTRRCTRQAHSVPRLTRVRSLLARRCCGSADLCSDSHQGGPAASPLCPRKSVQSAAPSVCPLGRRGVLTTHPVCHRCPALAP